MTVGNRVVPLASLVEGTGRVTKGGTVNEVSAVRGEVVNVGDERVCRAPNTGLLVTTRRTLRRLILAASRLEFTRCMSALCTSLMCETL